MDEYTFIAQIVKEGRITIPRVARKLLRLKEGDFIRVQIIEKVKNGGNQS